MGKRVWSRILAITTAIWCLSPSVARGQRWPEAAAAPSEPSATSSQRAAQSLSFACLVRDRTWTVVVQHDDVAMPLVRWTDASTDVLVPPAPCWQASVRLQAAYERDRLDYITLGRVDGQLSLCSVGDRQMGCNRQNVLVFLSSTSASRDGRAQQVMAEWFELEFPPYGSTCDIEETVYVDLHQYLHRNPDFPLDCQCYCGFCVCPQ